MHWVWTVDNKKKRLQLVPIHPRLMKSGISNWNWRKFRIKTQVELSLGVYYINKVAPSYAKYRNTKRRKYLYTLGSWKDSSSLHSQFHLKDSSRFLRTKVCCCLHSCCLLFNNIGAFFIVTMTSQLCPVNLN